MVSPIAYVREVMDELKKVSWPTPAHTRDMTILVIVVTLLVGIYIGALDFVFQRLIGALLNR